MEEQYTILNAKEYDIWLKEQPAKGRVQILQRIMRVKEYGYFGDHKDLRNGISEFRWKNERRIYYAYIQEKNILLLLGGNKNGQDKDIKKAKKILQYHTSTKNED